MPGSYCGTTVSPIMRLDASDLLYQIQASRDYDAEPELDGTYAPPQIWHGCLRQLLEVSPA